MLSQKEFLCATNNNFPFQKHEQQVWGVQKSKKHIMRAIEFNKSKDSKQNIMLYFAESKESVAALAV